MKSIREEIRKYFDEQIGGISSEEDQEWFTDDILKLIEKRIDEMIKEHTITSQDNETTLFYSGYRYGLQDFKGMLK